MAADPGYLIRSTYMALSHDEDGWWRQDELGGPKTYSPEAEAQVRAVLPGWMIDEAEASNGG